MGLLDAVRARRLRARRRESRPASRAARDPRRRRLRTRRLRIRLRGCCRYWMSWLRVLRAGAPGRKQVICTRSGAVRCPRVLAIAGPWPRSAAAADPATLQVTELAFTVAHASGAVALHAICCTTARHGVAHAYSPDTSARPRPTMVADRDRPAHGSVRITHRSVRLGARARRWRRIAQDHAAERSDGRCGLPLPAAGRALSHRSGPRT